MSPVYLDISEFIRSPTRTGIQRVVREILKNWPRERELVPVELDADGRRLVRVDAVALRRALEVVDEDRIGVEALRAEMAERRRDGDAPDIGDDPVLMPELFFDGARCRFYRTAPRRAAFIVYDFLPWLHPEIIGAFDHAAPLTETLLTLMEVGRRNFISRPVQEDYERRIRRRTTPGDATTRLGSDGLGLARGAGARHDGADYLLCFGALDGRKRQDLVLDAFLQSRAKARLRLVFAGRIPSELPPRMRELVAFDDPAVEVVDDPSDATLARLVAESRAVIFTSPLEGYGLPATEALFAGVPVVAAEALPSLAGLPSFGQVRLPRIDAPTIAAALDRLADDAVAHELRRETEHLPLPTWADYGRELSDWVLSS